ncbi:MAG: hypothetical protein ACLP0J_05275, partial [Solirubrobacteraceae bacterium]
PTPPSCSLSAAGNQVLLKAPKKGKHGPKSEPGTLTLTARCDQAAELSLRGVLTETGKKPKHRKAKTTTFELGPVQTHLAAGAFTTVTMHLPTGALRGLEKNTQESVVFTLAATSAGATRQATAAIGRLRGIS